MTVSERIIHHPLPGSRHLVYRGDVFRLKLTVPPGQSGTAWARTNLGRAHIARLETIGHVEESRPLLHQDWTDTQMTETGQGEFELLIPVCETGHFEAKAYFLPEGKGQPVWPPGENISVNVEPADTVCGNIIYNAFVRQFGPNKEKRIIPSHSDECIALDSSGFTVIPPSGKFRDLIRELDFIVGELGCRWLQLLPVNPAPTTYGRMGRFGSPYAAQSFTAVDPAMAEFDPSATPLEQFGELVDAVHCRGAGIILDIAINHTGWGAAIHETHPRWLSREGSGKIETPGAWGVTWEDLTRLDYSHRDLWRYMAEVFLTWCRRGVDGFRCDAGYMIPVETWQYICARVREGFPDTVFFLEGLGGKISVTRDILNRAGFNWAYSELFQNYTRQQISGYLPLSGEISSADGLMVNFAETHDNNRLVSVSKCYARMRTALCALLSRAGGFAFANGVEWFAEEKIDVHDAPSLNWGAEENQVAEIRRLSAILRTHPVFLKADTEERFIMAGEGNFLAVLRRNPETGKALAVVANLDHRDRSPARWMAEPRPLEGEFLYDLFSGEKISVGPVEDGTCGLELAEGQVLCLSADPVDLQLVESRQDRVPAETEAGNLQKLKASAADVFVHYNGAVHTGGFDPDSAAGELFRDPENFCRRMNTHSDETRVVNWRWPRDIKRQVMVPPGHFLLIRAPFYFRARVAEDDRVIYTGYGLPEAAGGYFLLVPPGEPAGVHRRCDLKIAVYSTQGAEHGTGKLFFTSSYRKVCVRQILCRRDLISESFMFLATNGRGAMMRVPVGPLRLLSRYDALLAANPDENMPVDRWIMLTGCRTWVVYQDYSQALRTDCLQKFFYDYGSSGRWLYMIPTGLGLHIMLSVETQMQRGENTVRISFRRHRKNGSAQLDDNQTVFLIIRPDVESRSFHETTKAFQGPEHAWPAAVYPRQQGFSFSPDPEHILEADLSSGKFVSEPEWKYMEHRPVEAERGLDPDSDLFSPGYFRAGIKGGETVALNASAGEKTGAREEGTLFEPLRKEENRRPLCLEEAMHRAMKHYVVARNGFSSVIAGYPWFLDWGRDSLIFCRGLIAAGEHEKALSVIRLFGGFEKNGTLPNMIRGRDAGNRDTSDAPLWLITACRDLAEAVGSTDFLDRPLGDRTLRQVLFSIFAGYACGTENGIRMDPETGLIFSPAHFTWMDTNFPAATPREGYPVEIQALWYAGLSFLSKTGAPPGPGRDADPENIRLRVADSLERYYFDSKRGFLSDCLHCGPDTPPARAGADDALRPNQIFAVTMDAVTDPDICRAVLSACEELLVPGAIRSLADRRVEYPLEIRHNGNILGDPHYPYRGKYKGDEDTCRKPAYHNGTAWTWVFPSFCEAWVKLYGSGGLESAMARLGSVSDLVNSGCLGHVPEITDGNAPHRQRGCDAQAWGASEVYRVWKHLLMQAGQEK